MDAIIHHNPDCGVARKALTMILNAGIEPHVIKYLKTPPTRTLLKHLITRMGNLRASDVAREWHTQCGVWSGNRKLIDEELLDAVMAFRPHQSTDRRQPEGRKALRVTRRSTRPCYRRNKASSSARRSSPATALRRMRRVHVHL